MFEHTHALHTETNIIAQRPTWPVNLTAASNYISESTEGLDSSFTVVQDVGLFSTDQPAPEIITVEGM